ncbi:hypothetical protein CYANOKiyG1_05960 [Okeania sp. KiyG1]|nr:hypothetical protein CYANOKiyG1_05960 [Okeania sp. KiyG1]
MYKKLSTQGKLGFFLKVESTEKRKRLNNIYTQVAFEEEWPRGTRMSEVSEWEFTCRVQTQSLSTYDACKFAYIDYAGGRLIDEMEEEDEEFNSITKNADIMLVLLDGQKLCGLMGGKRSDMIWAAKDLPSMLQQVQDNQRRPVHFVISKWDIVEPYYNLRKIRDRLLEIEEFTNLVRARNQAGIPVRLIPVSSVGKGFATLNKDGSMAKNDGVFPKPFQVEVPLACTLPDIIEKKVQELRQKIAAEQAREIEVKPELNWRDKFGKTLGSIGQGVKTIQKFLPKGYRFDEDILEVLIEFAEKPAREKKAVAQRRTEELRIKQAKSLNKVVDEKTALDSAVNSFLSIRNQLDIDFPESDLRNVL